MPSQPDTCAWALRLHRLLRPPTRRALVVPLDHSVTTGPITRGRSLDALVAEIATQGADAVVLHKGSVRHVSAAHFTDTALVVHLSASTVHAPDPDEKYAVATVEEALRLGADAVSVHVNLGSEGEAAQVAALAATAEACYRWNVPLLAMVYPRGPEVDNPHAPELVAHAASLAADLGADLVKVPMPEPAVALSAITHECPIRVLVAGGLRRTHPRHVAEFVDEAMAAGASGVAVGRNVFEADDPGVMTRSLAARVHAYPRSPADAGHEQQRVAGQPHRHPGRPLQSRLVRNPSTEEEHREAVLDRRP